MSVLQRCPLRESRLYFSYYPNELFSASPLSFFPRGFWGVMGGNTSSVRARTVSAKILLSESVLLTTISPSLQDSKDCSRIYLALHSLGKERKTTCVLRLCSHS